MDAVEKRLSASEMPIRVAGNVKPPRVLRRVEPSFPPGAQERVILELTISGAGRVTAVRALRGDPALVAAAEKALREWVFEPTLVDGRPVAILYTVSFSAR